ncbi:hypothetical protein B5M09_011265 [Aphanomyces astaci]|uniref:Uncharacterized protein n=1 Tax=Aphanomyces astaci TaxID=112090 RepID=A0A3R7Z4X4_APHAT|nr:hypothetical protein B5M09_011265 [Aphanomyces astaci]
MPPHVLVKEQSSTFRFVFRLVPPSVKRKTFQTYTLIVPWISHIIGFLVLVLVFVDAIANNWAVNDYCGNALQFRTPFAHIETASELPNDFIFGQGRGFSNMSFVGRWMMSLAVSDVASHSDSMYILTAGQYSIQAATMNYCGTLNGNYSVPDLSMPVKLAVVDDGVTYLRGDALSHWFTNDLVDNLPTKSSKKADVQALGFHPARMQADLRLTMGLDIKNTSKTQTFAVSFYRVYSKSYCTGCVPLATLGHGTCNLTVQYIQRTNMVVVTKSFSMPDSTHYLGLMFSRSIYTIIGSVLKYVAILIGMAGFLASRKTVQWHDRSPDKVESVTEKLMDMVVPKYFSHQSFAMTFDLFCYNSDLLVLLFVVSNLLDMNQAIQYIREVNAYNALSPQWDMTVKLFALSTRLLWLNVGLVKLAKMTVHFVSSATYSGHSRVMSWLNFSSVTTLYLSAILLYFVPDYIEYNNICRWDIANSLESINGSVIDSFKSFYFRGAPAIGIGLALNVAGVLAVDHLVLFEFWRNLSKNSLRAPSYVQHHVHHV